MRVSFRFSTAVIIGLQLWAQSEKDDLQAHVRKAREALAHHDLRQASEEYGEALKLDPGNAEFNAARGIALYALGEASGAIAPLKAALASDPARTDAETFLGLSLADVGRCTEALALLRRRFNEEIDLKLRRLAGLALLGCTVASTDPEDGIDIARQLKRAYPDDPDVLYQVAELYSQLSRISANDLLKKHPDSFRVHELAGEALESQNDDSQALIEYRKALELNPKAPHLHYRIATILLREKKATSDTEALQEFKEETRVNPADAPSEYQIAEILRKKDQLDDADVHFRRALDLDPVFVEGYIGLAKLELSRHQAEAAIQHLKTAVQLAPEDPAPHYSLMLAYRELGRMDGARREMATVEDLNTAQSVGPNITMR
jgi:tetratricopeptide (TPR) repeat protein